MNYLKYDYINNNAGKLIIVFQGVVQEDKLEEALKYEYGTSEYMEAFDRYASAYTHFRLTNNKDYDYLFVQDNINHRVSWFLFDGDEFILPKLCNELDLFISQNNYSRENVVTFGTSKGGFSARLFAYNCSNIGNIVCGIPIFQLHTFDVENVVGRKSWEYHISSSIFGSKERRKKTNEIVFEMFSSDKILNSNIKEIIVCGWKDNYFVDDILSYKNPNVTYVVETKIVGHAPVIKHNYNEVSKILFSVFSENQYLPESDNFQIRVGPISGVEYFRYLKRNFKRALAKAHSQNN